MQTTRIVPQVVLLVFMCCLVGCGGSGVINGFSGEGTAEHNTNVTVGASRTSVAPGESVTIYWASRNADRLSSNFGTTSLVGQATRTLETTQTFTVTASRGDESVSDSVTVPVTGEINNGGVGLSFPDFGRPGSVDALHGPRF